MIKSLVLFCLLTLSFLSIGSEQSNWRASLAMIAADQRLASDAPAFLQVDHYGLVAFPNISWHGENWTFGLTGVSYKQSINDYLNFKADVGFPFSGLELSGERGWLRYKAATGLVIQDGLKAQHTLEAAGLTAKLTHGLADKVSEQSWQTSFGGPLYLNKAKGINVFATLGYQFDNPDYASSNYDNDFSDWLAHPQLNTVAIVKFNPEISLLFTASHTWLDEELVEKNELAGRYSLGVFALLSYQF